MLPRAGDPNLVLLGFVVLRLYPMLLPLTLLAPIEAQPAPTTDTGVELKHDPPEIVPVGTRAVQVKCKLYCRVYLNGRRVYPEDLSALSPGTYHLRIEADDGSLAPAQHDIVIEPHNDPLIFSYGPALEPRSHDLPPRRSFARQNEAQMEAGRITMAVGAASMFLGLGAFAAGVFGTDDLGLSLTGVFVGGLLGSCGLVTLTTGGIVYGVGKHASKRRARTRLRALPRVGFGRHGAQVGFALAF